MATLTPEQIESLVNTVLDGPVIERPSALFNLLKATSDPDGSVDCYQRALEAMQATLPLTREYEMWCQERIASPIRLDFSA